MPWPGRSEIRNAPSSHFGTDIRHQVTGGAPLDELAELVARVVVLTGGDGDPDGSRDLGTRRDVVGQRRLLVPDEVEVLEELGLADGAVDVELLVHVHHHLHAVAERLAHRLYPLAIHEGVWGMDLHLVVAAPRARVAGALADEIADRVRAPAAAAVRVHPVRGGAPQLGEREVGCFTRQIPERDVERGQGVAGDAHATDAAVCSIHLVPEPADEQRVLADQELRQTAGVGFDRFRARPAEHQRVAQPLRPRIAMDAGHDQAVLRQVERDRLDGRDAERERVDADDLHGYAPPRWRCTTKEMYHAMPCRLAISMDRPGSPKIPPSRRRFPDPSSS